MRRPPAPIAIRLDDEKTEQVRRNIDDRLSRVEKRSEPVFISDVELVDGIATRVAHNLGRRPKAVISSVVRGAVAAGYINEVRDGTDRTRAVVLQADDYGATITVDLVVYP